MVEHVAAGGEFRPCRDELVRDGLVLADRLAELHALAGILPGFFQRRAGEAVGDRRNLDLLDIQRAARQRFPALVPFVRPTDDGAFWQADIIEEHVHRMGVAQVRVFDGLHRDALGVRRHKDEREIAMPVTGLAGAAEAVDVVGPVGARAPALGALDDEFAILALDPRLDARQVPADIRLRKTVGQEQLAARELWQQRLFLFL